MTDNKSDSNSSNKPSGDPSNPAPDAASGANPETSKPVDFIPVRLGTLRPSEPVSFDVFIKIGDRHVHYLKREDPFDADRIKSLKSKGVKKLFVPKDAEFDYLAYLDAGLTTLKNTKMALSDRADIARDSMVAAAENASKNVSTEAGYKKTETQVSKVLEFLVSEKGAMRQMLSSTGFAVDVSQHAANVVSLSVRMASSVGMSENDLINIGMAALLHDIGKENLGLDPMLPREKMTSEQLLIYMKHAEAGYNKVFDRPYVSKTILDLIMNHEEVGDGAGFPNKKRLSSLPKLQQILNLCNEYDRSCTVNKTAPLDAIKQFYVDKLGHFDMAHLKKLSEIIKG